MIPPPGGWQEDPTFSARCESGPGPTSDPTAGPTDPGPGPGGLQPTIVAIKRQTVPGSDVFIVGGVAPDKAVDIR